MFDDDAPETAVPETVSPEAEQSEPFDWSFGLPDEFNPPPTLESDQPPDLDVVEYEARGHALGKLATENNWAIGDWLVEGEYDHPEFKGYPQPGWTFWTWASSVLHLAATHLRDLASTARRVKPSVRTDKLPWSHHRVLINALPDADEDTLKQWLTRAADEGLTITALKEALKSPAGPPPTLKKSFLVTVPLGVWEMLKDFADADQSTTIQAVAAEWIVEHSEQPETQGMHTLAKEETKERRYQQRSKNGRMVARNYNPLGLEQ